ncbi:hypothetical protein DES53_112119 [Roseimicrobium gellanilyticum]|uniref:Uncharacterized protein n=1 Tax=Roseimicrobium gellanilyticum TaxID=748857 RepID=A0A366H7H5_9BACT|nr:hypothetical protein [Roseimicrobium gellanilyticum]RBP38121.1 hypothetical protein DES53_112119 [Roseimicrobium gellanilyticum]
MITGLVVSIQGAELQKLCKARAAHHRKRAKVYEEQIRGMKENQIEASQLTNGDPVRNLQSQLDHHLDEAGEMAFIANHLESREKYRLERADLAKLGICKGRGW